MRYRTMTVALATAALLARPAAGATGTEAADAAERPSAVSAATVRPGGASPAARPSRADPGEVPEPASLAMLAAGVLGLATLVRRRVRVYLRMAR